MRILAGFGICVAILIFLLLALFLQRRLLMRSGGTITLQVRVTAVVPGRGWSAGLGVFAGDELRFYRMFSFAPRPKRALSRNGLVVDCRRRPVGPERMIMPSDWVVLRCTSFQAPVEIAMAANTVTGFLSWLEAGPPGPPGSVAPRPATRLYPTES
jgi:Protein of unknown function (DUF2550)